MPVNRATPEPIEEVLHGVRVVDPYRWLEERTSRETEQWLREQKAKLEAYFATLSSFHTLQARVAEFLNVEVFDQPTRIGQQCFYRRRSRDQEQACICVRNTVTNHERLLVDPAPQGPLVSVGILHISKDGSLLAYGQKNGGEDTQAVRLVDVASGRILPESLDRGYVRGLAFAPDGTGLYYCHEPVTSTVEHTIQFHRFGNSMRSDRVVFRIAWKPGSRLVLTSDEKHLGAIFLHAEGSDILLDLFLAPYGSDEQWARVAANKPPPYEVLLKNGHIYTRTGTSNRNSSVVQLTDNSTAFRAIVPELNDELREVAIIGETIYVSYTINGESSVRNWRLSGEYLGTLNTPANGSVTLLPAYSSGATSLFYSWESFTDRPAIFEYLPDTRQSALWAKPPHSHGWRPFQTRRVSYPAKDHTEIPMSLVSLTGSDSSARRPAIMTGYGGFGVSMTPQFSVLVAILVELGALFALPNIRGGSEFGRAWHEAARARNRQVAFDDFLSAADWLCHQGWTSPQQLAIFGGSNSGLLVAAAMTQRPDLFRAVLCIAPLLDMIRYQNFDRADIWRGEYGTVDDPEDFHALHSYSPYHRIEGGTGYPSTLFISGDSDNRCNPAHVRKMAARLQDRQAQTNPVLVDYSAERGHSPVLPLSVRIEALTRRIAFLCCELKIQIPDRDWT